MPVNPPQEYYAAEKKYIEAKKIENKILYLEEMIRLMPKHHGSEAALAQLKARLARLRKEAAAAKKQKKSGGKASIQKEGYAQVCLIGKTMSGKSLILSKLTEARPKIATHTYTTIKPEVGMMEYKPPAPEGVDRVKYGIRIQLVELPATLESEYISIARTADLIAFVITDDEEKKKYEKFKEDNLIKKPHIFLKASDSVDQLKKNIWQSLDLILVYTKDRDNISPMALPKGSTVREFAYHIHKDFVANFRFAQLWRKNRRSQVGLDYILQDGDIVELHMR